VFLKNIIDRKREEVRRLKKELANCGEWSARRKGKKIDLKCHGERNIIAEIKRKSPSKGVLRDGIDPVHLAGGYIKGGAKAISVLTDTHFFGGSGDDLTKVVTVAGEIPVLRKDFVIDEIQLHESAHLGADMVLLIARILTKEELRSFVKRSVDIGLVPLVEVHNEGELKRAIDIGVDFIGINNRDLETFRVDIAVSEKLIPLMPKGKTVVIESGIHAKSDMERLESLGADAFLIGEALILADDPAEQLKIFIGKKHERSAT
jgi:indole-3-glycerol phosphate synthase